MKLSRQFCNRREPSWNIFICLHVFYRTIRFVHANVSTNYTYYFSAFSRKSKQNRNKKTKEKKNTEENEKKEKKQKEKKPKRELQQMNGKTFTFCMSSDLFLESSFSNYRVTKYVYFVYRLFYIFFLSLFLSFFYRQSKRTAKLRSYRRERMQNVHVTFQVLDRSACVIADKRPTL